MAEWRGQQTWIPGLILTPPEVVWTRSRTGARQSSNSKVTGHENAHELLSNTRLVWPTTSWERERERENNKKENLVNNPMPDHILYRQFVFDAGRPEITHTRAHTHTHTTMTWVTTSLHSVLTTQPLPRLLSEAELSYKRGHIQRLEKKTKREGVTVREPREDC